MCSDRIVVLTVVRVSAVKVSESGEVAATVLLAKVEAKTRTWPVLWATLMKFLDAGIRMAAMCSRK